MTDRQPDTELTRLSFTVTTERKLRLDVYLHEQIPWRSRTQVKDLIDARQVTVNGRPCKPAHHVRKGDAIGVAMLGPAMPDLAFRPGEIPVLYLDEHVLVLNKPSGILTHPIVGHQRDTLLNYAQETFGARYGEPHTCHRLDRETSGTILMAFDLVLCRLIQRQFERHRIRKEYLALVAGPFAEESRRIELPIREGKDLPSATTGERLRPSLTIVHRIAASPAASLVRALPVTGRQNQIRIHLAAIGFPLIGDMRFGGPPPLPTTSHFLLHAEKLSFYHPGQQLPAEIAAPPPPDFLATLEHCGLNRGHPFRPPG